MNMSRAPSGINGSQGCSSMGSEDVGAEIAEPDLVSVVSDDSDSCLREVSDLLRVIFCVNMRVEHSLAIDPPFGSFDLRCLDSVAFLCAFMRSPCSEGGQSKQNSGKYGFHYYVNRLFGRKYNINSRVGQIFW